MSEVTYDATENTTKETKAVKIQTLRRSRRVPLEVLNEFHRPPDPPIHLGISNVLIQAQEYCSQRPSQAAVMNHHQK